MSNLAQPAQNLLPRAGIDAFCIDRATRAALKVTRDDWRMGRVTLSLHSGGIAGAIEHYRQHPSPQLVAVELEAAANDVEGAIDRLASCCQPGTGAIVLGQTNDVRLYRRLTEMGVSDYLVGPYRPEELIGAFGRALAAVNGQSGRLVAVLGAKGGVGTTTIAQSIGWLAGERLGASSFIADLQGAAGTLGLAFGGDAKRSLDELLESVGQGRFDAEILSRVAQPVGEHLQLLPGGRGMLTPDAYAHDAIDRLLVEARTLADVTLVDLPAGLHPLSQHVATQADHLVLVTTPLLASLRNARMLLDELRQRRGSEAPVSVVVNGIDGYERAGLPLDAIREALDIKSVHTVPFAPNLFALAESNGRYFDHDSKADKPLRELLGLARELYAGTRAVAAGGNRAASVSAPGGGGMLDMLRGLMRQPGAA